MGLVEKEFKSLPASCISVKKSSVKPSLAYSHKTVSEEGAKEKIVTKKKRKLHEIYG